MLSNLIFTNLENFMNKKICLKTRKIKKMVFFYMHTKDDVDKDSYIDSVFDDHDSAHRKRPRLVKKCGELNVNSNKVPKRKRRLLSDIFNTILDIKWRWHIMIFLSSFTISWFFFAAIWYMIAFVHNDIDHESSENKNISTDSINKIPCISGVHDFTSALLYSIETQHTIGYGHRHITEECPFAIVFLMLQSCIGKLSCRF
jgi:potassium inwardly-rectifying channel subfamily J